MPTRTVLKESLDSATEETVQHPDVAFDTLLRIICENFLVAKVHELILKLHRPCGCQTVFDTCTQIVSGMDVVVIGGSADLGSARIR